MSKIATTVLLSLMVSYGARSATITVNYNSGAQAAWPWPADAIMAFDEAIDIWEETIYSPFEIKIDAYYENFATTGAGASNVLGFARATSVFANFGSTHPAYASNVYYVVSLAEKLNGTQFTTWNQHPYHIEIHMNSAIAWDFDISFNPTQNHYDFISTSLHEIGHGLGFVSSAVEDVSINQAVYSDSIPYIMDMSIVRVNSGTTTLTSLPASGTTTNDFLISDQVFFDGTSAVIANGSSKPKLYAPTTWQQGSSISHWDQGSFSTLDNDALMHPSAGYSSVNFHRHVGDVTTAFMHDIGWEIWPIGIEKSDRQLDLYVFPNPSNSGMFWVTPVEESGKYSIYDIRGRSIVTAEFKDGKAVVINLSHQDNGIYLARIQTESKDQYIKLIKNN